jgi:peptidoglycan L-alanyl-D-glutamate endopeptidase CwlK
MGIVLTASDRLKLTGVHPDLVRVIEQAARITTIPFKITEGLRDIEQQKKNIAKGVSWTLRSRHLTGHAVDLVPMLDVDGDGKVSSAEQYSWPVYYKLAPIIKKAAAEVGVPVEWGGDWSKNKDGPHWQLPWKQYPVSKSGRYSAEMSGQPKATQPTEKTVAVQKTVAASTLTVTSASGIGSDAVQNLVGTVASQQGELTSGDWFRIVLALVIIVAGGYFIWKTWDR